MELYSTVLICAYFNGVGYYFCVSGPVFTKGLSQGLGLKLRLLSQVSAQNLLLLSQ